MIESLVFWEIVITLEFGIGILFVFRSLNKSQKVKEINTIYNNKRDISAPNRPGSKPENDCTNSKNNPNA